MALPIKPGAVFGLLKELRATRDERPLLVAGTLAEQLAHDLAAGGDPSAIRTGGPPEDVSLMLYVLGDSVTDDDERVLKLAHRARVPTIVITAGRKAPSRIPFVLATDIVRVEPGHGFPVDDIARAIASKLGEKATSLARRLPVVRPAVVERLIDSFSKKNGIIGAAVFIPGVDLPVLTLNQIRMVLAISAAYGLDADAHRAPELAGTIAAGLGFRSLARQLLNVVPILGWVIKGAVAYGGTRAIGEAAVRYCEARAATQLQPASASASSF
jgi:uncharacterized protein (DUF697 family)